MSENNGIATSEFDFDAQDQLDLTPKEIRGIKYQGKEYLLRPTDEDGFIKFNDRRMQFFKVTDGKYTQITGGSNVSTFLLSLCLFEIIQKPDGSEGYKPVPEMALRKWKPHHIQKLFEKAKEISYIDRPDKRTRDQKILDLEKELAKLKKEKADEERLVEVDENGKPVEEADSGDVVGNLLGATEATSA